MKNQVKKNKQVTIKCYNAATNIDVSPPLCVPQIGFTGAGMREELLYFFFLGM